MFIFTGRGKRHGYNDEISPDGTVRYFGEGQKGDMTLTKGNKPLRITSPTARIFCSSKCWVRGRCNFAARLTALDTTIREAKINPELADKRSFSIWCRC